MLQISQQQVSERWDALPDNLKEALCSEFNANTVWQIGAFNHLSEEKISIIAIIVGDVIYGFLHPDDLDREIQQSLNLNPQIADSISREINRKIFAPIKTDLEKVYQPPIVAGAEAPATTVTAGIKKFEPPVPSATEPSPKPIEIIAPSKPAETTLPPLVEPSANFKESKPAMPSEPISTDKPFMIHQETGAQQVTEKKKVSMPTIGWFKKTMPSGRQENPKIPEPPVKVQLETFGPKIEERKESKEPTTAKTEIPKQKIVHYREVETPAPFGRPGAQPPKEVQPPKIEIPAAKPFDTAQDRPFNAPQTQGKPFGVTQGKPFNTTQGKPEPPRPFGATQNEPPITTQSKSPDVIPNRPYNIPQNRPEPAKSEQTPAKPTEPKVINLESFLEPTKENQPKNEVELEGNIINLKDNKK